MCLRNRKEATWLERAKGKGVRGGVGKQKPVGHIKESKFYFKGNGEPLVVLEHMSSQMHFSYR